MNIWGILIGLAAFLLIGIFHPIVIKCEYHFGAKIWPLFLVAGVLCCVASLLVFASGSTGVHLPVEYPRTEGTGKSRQKRLVPRKSPQERP